MVLVSDDHHVWNSTSTGVLQITQDEDDEESPPSKKGTKS